MRYVRTWFFIIFIFQSSTIQAEITLSAPEEISAGAQVNIQFNGNTNPRDFVTIVPADKPEGEYSAYQYVRSKSGVQLRAPEDPGIFEIRYMDANPPYATRARQVLNVNPVQATVDVPEQVDAGAKFQVIWTGPDNKQDFISLSDPKGNANARKWITYAYTKKGNPVTLMAPDKPGTYEIQYRTGSKYYTLAKTTLTVAGTSADVSSAKSLQAGQHFEVTWSGPGNKQDFIAISPTGSDVRNYHHYQYTSKGSPVILHAPDEPGDYEIRYQTGQSYTILASQSVTINPVNASLKGPAEVQGGSAFGETWTGPGNPADFIAVMEKGSAKRSSAKGGWAYTRHGNPAKLRAPMEPGDYEVRYQTGQSAMILATRPLRVTPPPMPPGQLIVTLDPGVSGFGVNDAVEIVLDASGSMLKKQDGRRRIEIARDVLLGLTGEVIPEGTPFALRVFGHKEADSCRTDLEEPLAPLQAARVDSKIKGLRAMNLARTPIARSLELVAQDLARVTGERVVVLITDGEETCDGDPAAVIESLKRSGNDVRVNIVGFAIDDEDLRARFRYWADLGGGGYYDAGSADELKRSMNHALQAPYRVLDASGEVVASGTMGDDGVQLPPGEYQVQTQTKPVLQAGATVVSDKKTAVVLQ